jgi:energy-coupling factor transporter ATP-binding protein EcfA2
METHGCLIKDVQDKLSAMRHAPNADFGTLNGRIPCLKDTRVDVLDELRAWAEGLKYHSQQIYSLSGHAGSGKSTIAQSFAEFLFSISNLGASFFCSRNSSARSDLTMIIPTIAYQLARANHPATPAFRTALLHALKENPDLPSSSLQNQLDRLLVQPIEESKMSTVVVIDALDECKDDSTTSKLLGFLAQNISRLPTVRFFITSRPEQHIRTGFLLEEIKSRTDTMVLHEVSADVVDADIQLVLRAELGNLVRRRPDLGLSEDWFKEEDVKQLAIKANGLFIYVSTVVRALDRKMRSPEKELTKLLENLDAYKHEGGRGLDDLYYTILKGVLSEKDDDLVLELRSVLGILVVARDLISAVTVATLLGGSWDAKNVLLILDSLHSVLLVPEKEKPQSAIQFYHKSFPDFLTDLSRCMDTRFQINRYDHEFEMAKNCLDVMDSKLKQNICGLKRYAMNDALDVSQRDKHIDESLRYSCRYWNDHILSISGRPEHLEKTRVVLDRWLTTRLLHWIEVLCLLDELGQAVKALSSIRDWLTSVQDLLQFAYRLLTSILNIVR